MEIFSDNIDSLRNELDIIKDSIGTTSFKKLIDNFELLEGFYSLMFEISGEEDDEAFDLLYKNKKYRALKDRERQLLHKKNILNFIQNKELHRAFSGRIIKLYDKDFSYYINKRLYLRDYQMADIICDFLDEEFNQADQFRSFIKNDRIFRVGISEDSSFKNVAGYTMYDFITNNSFVVISDDKKIADVDLMRIITHEFGHVVDNLDRRYVSRKDNVNYYWISNYAEVYSMLYEKLFYDYLIRHNIFKGNASWSLKQFYMDIFDHFNSIEYVSSLEDRLIVNERYKKANNIAEQIQVTDDGITYIDAAILDNFNEINLYSYGGVIACYFADLKHRNPEEFNRQFHTFKERRFGLFDFKILEDIGTNTDEVVQVFDKGLVEITDNKKLILN